MALNKFDVLSLGRNNLTDNTNAAIIFSANNLVEVYSAANTYDQYNVVEFSGRMYRSKVSSNLNNSPDTSPNQWETLYIGPKDGDIAIVIAGAQSTILQRVNGIYAPASGQPIQIDLNDNQVSAADVFVYIGSDRPFVSTEYTLRRGAGHDWKRKGIFNALNDGSATIAYDHEFMEIGPDIDAYLFWDMDSGNARLRYTSGNAGATLQFKYSLKGWN